MTRSKVTSFNVLFALLFVLSISMIAACSSDSDDDSDMMDGDVTDGDTTDGDDVDGDDVDGDEPETAAIRVIHLSPDAPAVDVFANGALRAVEDLGFGEGTDYLDVPGGTYTFDVVPTGGEIGDSVLNVSDLPLEAGKSYTAAAYGMVSNIAALALEDDLSEPDMGNIRVRAIHAADGVGEVDIWNIPESGDPSILYENVGYGVVGDYLDIPAGSYTLGFDVDNDATPDLVFETGALPEGLIANLFAVKSGGEVFILAQTQDGSVLRIDPMEDDEPETAAIRVIHLSPDAPAVDVFVNGTLRAVEDLAFSEGTEYLDVPADTYTFDVVPADGEIGDSVLNVSDLPLEAGKSYTAAAYGMVSNIAALALEDDLSEPDMGDIRVRAIHAADGVGEVDIWNIPESGDPSILYENVGYGVVGDYLDIPAGSYTLGFDVDNDATPDLTFTTPDLPEGAILNVFAVLDGSDVKLIAQFADGSTATINANQ